MSSSLSISTFANYSQWISSTVWGNQAAVAASLRPAEGCVKLGCLYRWRWGSNSLMNSTNVSCLFGSWLTTELTDFLSTSITKLGDISNSVKYPSLMSHERQTGELGAGFHQYWNFQLMDRKYSVYRCWSLLQGSSTFRRTQGQVVLRRIYRPICLLRAVNIKRKVVPLAFVHIISIIFYYYFFFGGQPPLCAFPWFLLYPVLSAHCFRFVCSSVLYSPAPLRSKPPCHVVDWCQTPPLLNLGPKRKASSPFYRQRVTKSNFYASSYGEIVPRSERLLTTWYSRNLQLLGQWTSSTMRRRTTLFQLVAHLAKKDIEKLCLPREKQEDCMVAAHMFLKINWFDLQETPIVNDAVNDITNAHVAVTTTTCNVKQ